jgi:hypothetical protein
LIVQKQAESGGNSGRILDIWSRCPFEKLP